MVNLDISCYVCDQNVACVTRVNVITYLLYSKQLCTTYVSCKCCLCIATFLSTQYLYE